MMEKDHQELASFIKSVHEHLREQTKLLGEDAAWKLHCLDEEQLQKYAFAMKELSLNFWEANFEKKGKAVSRIKWAVETCVRYFKENINDFRQKEESIIKKLNIENQPLETHCFINQWKILDVGSCNNPFKSFDCFDVTAIDIAPATDDVYKCDFLNLKIGNFETKYSNVVSSLKSNSFDVIIFSLFLGYLPSPKQRLECCKKAYELLKTEGLLIIITPDSKHLGANAKLMKSWRFVLAKIGFYRIKYEKLPHIHCMAFRKSFTKHITLNWVKLYSKQQSYDGIYIPQDFTVKPFIQDNNELKHIENLDEAIQMFSELPGEY